MPRAIKVSDPIGGNKFRVTQWNATQGLEHSLLVLQSAAPALASIQVGGDETQLSMELIAGIAKGVDAPAFTKIRDALVSSTEIEMSAGVWVPLASCFDEMFAGKLLIAFKVLAFAFKVQFADFFDLLLPGGRPAS